MKELLKGHSPNIRLLASGFSLLLSGLMVMTGWLPNEDAFTYIRTVELFNSDGLAAAFSHYPWATYPLLIAAIQNLLHISPFLAAVMVNALFYSLLVYSFISIVAEFDDSRSTLILAAVTVLVYPQLNESRLLIIRDSAFWSLALFGLWQFLRFLRDQRPANAAVFLLAFLLASLFRVEALAFLFLVPFALLFDNRLSPFQRWKKLGAFIASAAVILLLLLFGGWLLGLNPLNLTSDQLSVYLPFIRETFAPDDARAAELSRALFGDYAANFTSDYLSLFMLAGLFAVLLAFILKGVGGPFLLVLLAGPVRKAWQFPRWQVSPLLLVIAVNTLIAMAFLVTTRFLSSRYVMFMCLVVALYVPFLLNRMLLEARAAGRGKLIGSLVGLLLFYCAADAYISFGEDKQYLQEAGDWIAANSTADTRVLTNNRTVAYYSRRIADYDQIPLLLSESEILQVEPGTLIAFEEDTASLGLFAGENISPAVEEVIRIGPESGRQIVIYRRR